MRKRGRLVGWFVRPDLEMPRNIRFAVFALGLIALGGSYVATESNGLQVLVLLGLIFGLVPAITRKFGVATTRPERLRDHAAPFRVLALSLLLIAPWAALTFAIADLGLGDWFWMWALLLPLIEIHTYLEERDLRRTGGADWRKPRPVRDPFIGGLVTAPLLALLGLLDGESLHAAAIAGLVCGGIVFGMGIGVTGLFQRPD